MDALTKINMKTAEQFLKDALSAYASWCESYSKLDDESKKQEFVIEAMNDYARDRCRDALITAAENVQFNYSQCGKLVQSVILNDSNIVLL